jgi:hypothetical protein
MEGGVLRTGWREIEDLRRGYFPSTAEAATETAHAPNPHAPNPHAAAPKTAPIATRPTAANATAQTARPGAVAGVTAPAGQVGPPRGIPAPPRRYIPAHPRGIPAPARRYIPAPPRGIPAPARRCPRAAEQLARDQAPERYRHRLGLGWVEGAAAGGLVEGELSAVGGCEAAVTALLRRDEGIIKGGLKKRGEGGGGVSVA